jgi:hypothetical protein
MKVTIEREQAETITRIVVDRADEIDRTKLGALIGLSKQYVSFILSGGRIPKGEAGEALAKKIQSIPFKDVKSSRKLPGRTGAK